MEWVNKEIENIHILISQTGDKKKQSQLREYEDNLLNWVDRRRQSEIRFIKFAKHYYKGNK